MSSSPQENAEKAVKILVENHRLVLTLVGFFIAGLFAYAGKNVLDGRYFWALGLFILAGILVVLAVSVAIEQAHRGKYNAYDKWMTCLYLVALLSIILGTGFIVHLLWWPPVQTQAPTLSPAAGIRIDGARTEVGYDTKVRAKIQYDPSGRVQVIEINPP